MKVRKLETKKDLREYAKEQGYRGYSRLTKEELRELISKPPLYYEAAKNEERRQRGEYTKKELNEIAKNAGLRGYSKLKKDDLIEKLRENYILSSDIFDVQEPAREPRHPFKIRKTASALNQFTNQYAIDAPDGYDPTSFLKTVKQSIISLLSNNTETKSQMILKCVFENTNLQTDETVTTEAAFRSITEIILESTNFDELYEIWKAKILESIDTFQNNGSGWIFKSIVSLEIHTVKYRPLSGSSYIPLPKYLADKKALINLKNDDQQCFKWAVTRALNSIDIHPERIDKKLRAKAETLNWDGITFPTPLSEIDRFERNNPTISVNVFGFAEKGSSRDAKYENTVYPLRTRPYEREHEVDLLLFSGETKHYCVIKNLSRLLSSQKSKNEHVRFYCRRCCNSFTSEERLAEHDELCRNNETVKIEMPKDFPAQYFIHHFKSQSVPFVVYADFESFTKPISSCQPDSSKSYTNRYQKHEPSGFCYYIKCFDDSVYSQDPVTYTKQSEDEDIAKIFVETLEKNIREIYDKFWNPHNNKYMLAKNMIFGEKERKIYEESTNCHICKQSLTPSDKTNHNVRDHCHFTGKFRGAAHNRCNLDYRTPKFFPVFFHNLAGYDSHLFIKNLGKTEGEIDCIPNNEEKYISFTKKIVVNTFTNKEGEEIEVKRDLRFVDSFKFLSAGLDKLVANLTDYPEISKFFQDPRLLLRKGVYPYDHVNSLEKLQESNLPPKEAFYSKLNEEPISDEDYQHAQNVWTTFEMQTMREYHDLYLKSDVLLLADVFENFRKVCLQNYELDPCWYFTAPGLSYDAMLKTTGVNLDLLTDIDMAMMIEKGIRGGISMISTRYSKANNKYMGSDYDPSKESKFIQYLDANNLYGWAMSQKLPTGDFKWMTKKQLGKWSEHPCILEVDLEYPQELHDLHDDYPLAPERLIVDKVEKLIPNLNNKEKYVIHHEALKEYLDLGLKLIKVHRGIKFREEAFMEPYIAKNTRLRAQARSEFEKDFFKLMNNSVFGKTMENIRNRVDIQLVTSEPKASKLTSKPNYDRLTIFDENLIAVHMRKIKLYFNKPIYLGMSILDISKTKMYDFHYRFMKRKYGGRAKLLFTDSVTEDTPILVKDEDDNIYIKTIDNLTKEYKKRRDGKEYGKTTLKVWGDGGWNKIKHVIRHEVDKEIYRVSTKTGSVCVTKDHSLLDHLGNKIKPTDCKPNETKMMTGHPIHDNFRDVKLDQILHDIDDQDVERTIEERRALVYGFFYADGSCGTYQTKYGIKRTWALNNQNMQYLETCKKYLQDLGYESKILNTMKSSNVYKLSAKRPKAIVEEYRPQFYDERKFKKIPDYVLNADYNIRYNFFLGYYMGDGSKTLGRIRFSNKGQIGSAQLYYLAKSIGLNPRLSVRKDKPLIYSIDHASTAGRHMKKADNLVTKVEHYKYEGKYVYDLETVNGTFQAGIGEIIVHNTDSLAYEIQTEDFYKDITQNVKKLFDTSNYQTGHPSGIPTGKNKKVPGKFKDEAGGKVIAEFVGLRPKLYSYRMHLGSEEKKAKGVKKSVIQKKIMFEDYKRCLLDEKPQTRTMNVIRSYQHEMYTEEVNKIALDSQDDKRIILKDKIFTHAIGYKI